jgi:hypothetical protein
MLVIAPKENLARTFPSRVAVVIESSRGGAVTSFSFEDDLAGRSENIAPGRTDQVGKMLSSEFDDTDKAVEKIVDAGSFGGVGLIAVGDWLIASSSEGWFAVQPRDWGGIFGDPGRFRATETALSRVLRVKAASGRDELCPDVGADR